MVSAVDHSPVGLGFDSTYNFCTQILSSFRKTSIKLTKVQVCSSKGKNSTSIIPKINHYRNC